VLHIATEHAQVGELIPLQERAAIQEDVLRLMLNSSAFAWAERLSRLRKGGRPAFSREVVRRALGNVEPR
jgi:hypothetical protein